MPSQPGIQNNCKISKKVQAETFFSKIIYEMW